MDDLFRGGKAGARHAHGVPWPTTSATSEGGPVSAAAKGGSAVSAAPVGGREPSVFLMLGENETERGKARGTHAAHRVALKPVGPHVEAYQRESSDLLWMESGPFISMCGIS